MQTYQEYQIEHLKTHLRTLTARDLRGILSPNENTLIAVVELLIESGWKPKASHYHPDKGYCCWWVHPHHPIKNRPVGDSKPFYLAAWDTYRLYVKNENFSEMES